MQNHSVELGCGLIGIGRKWGFKETPVPTIKQALLFLQNAFVQSIRYFDTAPSYGMSEERLGLWLQELSIAERNKITVATKVGEHWSSEQQAAYVNHEYAAMKESIDQSLLRLVEIDVIYLHKTTPIVLRSIDVQKIWEYARRMGIQRIGASVSDLESAEIVAKRCV